MKQILLLILFSFFLTVGLSAQSLHRAAPLASNTQQVTKKIKIFPNPTTDYIGLSSDTNVGTIRILNLIGKEIRQFKVIKDCLLYTSPSPRDATLSRMPSSA